ncbi:uncharacterized protein LOC128127785 [Lactuca sativa]|uniref:uncharacterized protein LOC128127785 n=1 Tax=Lactuca sativa TaxID=4236 RepID=UPI0022AE6E52|nr:uncharacterized protein LOC128127785 [Lactuca sativa]
MDEIFPQTGQVSVPISNLFELYMKLFDDPETAILFEAKAVDNKVDDLKKVIDEAAKITESETSSSSGSQESTTSQEPKVNAELDPSYDPNYPPLTKWTKGHPKTQIIGESSERVLTRFQLKAKQIALFSQVEFCMLNSFDSKVEPKTINTALDHSDWVQAMQDELNEFERNKVWRLIPTPKDASMVGLKWVFRNKMQK